MCDDGVAPTKAKRRAPEASGTESGEVTPVKLQATNKKEIHKKNPAGREVLLNVAIPSPMNPGELDEREACEAHLDAEFRDEQRDGQWMDEFVAELDGLAVDAPASPDTDVDANAEQATKTFLGAN